MKKILLLLGIIVLMGGIVLLNNNSKEKTLILNGDKEITIELNQVFKDPGVNLKNVKVEGTVDNTKEGTYTLNYHYNKQIVSRTVYVINSNRIIINLNGSENTYVLKNEKYVESGCHVVDKKDGNITSEVTVKGNVDTSKIGDYTIEYQINHDHMTKSRKRTVHVVDHMDKNTTGIPVLMYHYIYTKNDKPKKLNTNYLLDTKLEEQLQYLTKENYYFPSYQELKAYVEGKLTLPKKSVILTFDDGEHGFLKYGIPLLNKYHVPATSFIIGKNNGKKKVIQYASEYISFQSHSYNMHRGGGSIGHGGIISALNKQEIINDLKKSQAIAQNTEAFAYPYGDVTDIAKGAVKETGILCSFTTKYGKVKVGSDLTALPRVRVLGDASINGYINSIE